MTTRRDFIIKTSALAMGTMTLSALANSSKAPKNIGLQLYSFRAEMLQDPKRILEKIASLGIKQIESASSAKGLFYGLSPKEMKRTCEDLGMTLRSGHVNIDQNWAKTMDQAAESGQEYIICSSMPSRGQTIDNYKAVADVFNKEAEKCKELGLKFGYHNHEYEFDSDQGQVLYDVLMDHTDPMLMHMELDLGWVIVAGKNPIDYFDKYPGRFPLWHLKDMDLIKKQSTEFGKGGLDINLMLESSKKSGLLYPFIEQEEYAVGPLESIRADIDYLDHL
jgi:sugar phosphate isomerase/epimerase